jgi:hypothetical protein
MVLGDITIQNNIIMNCTTNWYIKITPIKKKKDNNYIELSWKTMILLCKYV